MLVLCDIIVCMRHQPILASRPDAPMSMFAILRPIRMDEWMDGGLVLMWHVIVLPGHPVERSSLRGLRSYDTRRHVLFSPLPEVLLHQTIRNLLQR